MITPSTIGKNGIIDQITAGNNGVAVNSFYTQEELAGLGFKSIGSNVLISRKASIYGAKNITIGNNVRIDDFCVLSGKIDLGNHIHLAVGSCYFAGSAGIEIHDFVGVSSRTAIYAESDDFSGYAMPNPVVPDKYRNVTSQKVILHKHVLIGTGCTILPGSEIGEGTSVGSMSLVTKSLEPWGMYVGIPCRKIKDRDKRILQLEKDFLTEYESQ